jgi:ABC-type multidrug transport system fused ATPase/permease subunit
LAKLVFRRRPEQVAFVGVDGSRKSTCARLIAGLFGHAATGSDHGAHSHRPASVVECDRIFVFADGRIIETGTHRELTGPSGEYTAVFTLQAAGHRAEAGVAA